MISDILGVSLALVLPLSRSPVSLTYDCSTIGGIHVLFAESWHSHTIQIQVPTMVIVTQDPSWMKKIRIAYDVEHLMIFGEQMGVPC